MTKADFISSGKRTIKLEQQAISDLTTKLDERFSLACNLLLNCKGRVVVTGMGKSGHIAGKIAATLASTGTPAFFVHPADAGHGDLGMITENDVVIAISNSGGADEIVTILPILRRLDVPLVSLTGNVDSAIAQAAKINLDVSVTQEACPLDLAPTASTTAALVMGDALAVALLEARGFTTEDFALSHPRGRLGRRLLLKVNDVMRANDNVPIVKQGCLVPNALAEMTSKALGMTTVIDEQSTLIGIFTDGDLRRAVDKGVNLSKALIETVMTATPQTSDKDMLAAEALTLMETKKITTLVVTDTANKPIGVLHMHDLLQAGLI